jgi:hypothetical protein
MATELTTSEIRKLIKVHNVLASIKIPPKASRQQIIKLIEDKGYVVDHVKKQLTPTKRPRLKPVKLSEADKILKKPEKTDLQKQKTEEAKAKKADAQKKRDRELKKEAVKKATKVPVKKPDVKKPMKKEDEVRKARQPYPTIPKNVKGKRIKKSSKEDDVRPATKAKKPTPRPLLLEDKKKGQVIKQPDKISMKDKLIAKDRKGEADKKDAVKQRKEAKKPYKPSADSSIKELMFKLFDYFEKDKNKVGKTFKTVKEVNTAIGNVFSSIKGEEGDALASLGSSDRKYFIKLMNSMLRNSSTEKDGVEVTKQSLKKYKGWYSATAFADGKEAQRKKETAPARLEKKLLKAGSQLEDKSAIRAREKADKLKAQEKEEKKQVKKTGKPVVKNVPDTFDYEETSGYSTALKSALKQLYKLANSIINEINKLKPKDFVESDQKLVFSKKYVDGGEDLSEKLDDDDLDIFNEVSEELDQELETTMSAVLDKNREETGWTPPIPKLSTLQAKYKQALAGGGSRKTLTGKLKAQIIKYYKESDVPKNNEETVAIKKPETATKLWDTIKDLKWKENVRTKIRSLFNAKGTFAGRGKDYYIIKEAQIKDGKFVIKWVYTRYRAEGVSEFPDEATEEDVIKLMTKPQTSKFVIPK